jgi:hypothetical protein
MENKKENGLDSNPYDRISTVYSKLSLQEKNYDVPSGRIAWDRKV